MRCLARVDLFFPGNDAEFFHADHEEEISRFVSRYVELENAVFIESLDNRIYISQMGVIIDIELGMVDGLPVEEETIVRVVQCLVQCGMNVDAQAVEDMTLTWKTRCLNLGAC